jgi:two-component system, cell cycle sensor histidine kinase and response regulator CckA
LSKLDTHDGPAPAVPKTILVVEDQDVVRAMVTRSLLEEGYRVIEASDGEQALAAVLAAGVKIDMLVTDIVMPKLDGLQLAQHLTLEERAPVLLFITGYDQDLSKVPGPLLRKPFGPSELVAEVRRLLLQA